VDLDGYWALVEKARPKDNDAERHVAALERALVKLPAEEIVSYERINAGLVDDAYRADLWDMASAINGGCSDDGFEYFLWWLVVQGRDVYELALADPQSLIEISAGDEDFEEESFGYVAMHAYEGVADREWDPEELGLIRRTPRKLKGRFTRTDRGFRRKFPMAWRVLGEPPVIDPSWLKWGRDTVKRMAREIQSERRWADLPVLADALADAGCADGFLLGHLREGRCHARQCWALHSLLRPARA
jgi:hypothetical protein